ncbi:MAG: nucleotidyltransferase [Verrucomicrobia bacterium]|nr:nucleotidyltransferase [Verrucomicrobiota bacterium]MCH8529004.1 nucleotidyltransferase [Kiritimatiellia bacterium]
MESRPPTEEDFVALCRSLNDAGARYVVVGGFAVIHAGYPRFTADIDLVVDVSPENEQRVFQALSTLPDGAVRELQPGEIESYVIVRVADEITVDLMASASGCRYQDLAENCRHETLHGVKIPFASHEDLWRMKRDTHREKDRGDLYFLREWFATRGIQPPSD